MLTSEQPWSPSPDDFAEKEVTISKVSQLIKDLMLTGSICQLSAVVSYMDVKTALETFDDDFGQMVENTVRLHPSYVDPSANVSNGRYISAIASNKRTPVITPEVLACRWHIGLEATKQIMTVTTQSGLCNIIAPGEQRVHHQVNHMAILCLHKLSLFVAILPCRFIPMV